MESRAIISMSENSEPLWPSTLRRKRVSGSLNRMEFIFIPFLALLLTIRRAVGVPTPVNTVSKLTVSREKVSTSWGDVLMASLMHDVSIP